MGGALVSGAVVVTFSDLLLSSGRSVLCLSLCIARERFVFLIFCFNDISLFWRENTVYRGMLIIYKIFFSSAIFLQVFVYIRDVRLMSECTSTRFVIVDLFFFSCGKFCPVLVLQQKLPR